MTPDSPAPLLAGIDEIRAIKEANDCSFEEATRAWHEQRIYAAKVIPFPQDRVRRP
jgi:hypothetical protein